MAEKIFNITIPEPKRLKAYLQVVNSIFKLTSRELDILEAFILIDPILACSTEARKQVNEQFNLNSIAIVNNHVKALKDKGAIMALNKRAYSYHALLAFTEDVDKIVINIISGD